MLTWKILFTLVLIFYAMKVIKKESRLVVAFNLLLMAISETFFFVIFSFLSLSLQPSASVQVCRVPCGDQTIRFPFRLNEQNDRCGYPGFDLSCRNQTQTILNLPFAGEFRVESIDYWFQSIWINDPDNCTPKRLLKGLNLSDTPFQLIDPQSYVFLNCSIKPPPLSEIIYISCLSDETFSFVAISIDLFNMYAPFLPTCWEVATMLVPAFGFQYGMRLTWKEPNCIDCEKRGGSCMFKSDTGLSVGCSVGFTTGLPSSAKYGLAFGLGIPLLCVIGVVAYLRRQVNDFNLQPLTPEGSFPVTRRGFATFSKGLDGAAIEACPITVISETLELPRPNDNTCPICLCEYQAKETLRTIPDCKHYFHASCIDEWLKLNATCPVCRNTAEGFGRTDSSSL